MKLKELRSAIVVDNDDQLNNADITAWINRALDDLALTVRYKKPLTINVVAGQSTYQLPPDFLEVAAMNSTENLMSLPLEDFTSTGYKILNNSSFIIQPVPQKAYTITLYYVANLPRLVGDNDVPLIPEPFHDLLILFVLSKTKFIDELTGQQNSVESQYYARKQELNKFMNKANGKARPIRNVYGGYNGV